MPPWIGHGLLARLWKRECDGKGTRSRPRYRDARAEGGKRKAESGKRKAESGMGARGRATVSDAESRGMIVYYSFISLAGKGAKLPLHVQGVRARL
jgi:hypothetical protein